MRTFIAIELPQETKNHLAKLQEQLKTTGADVKWVTPHNIHLTLKFLGETNEKKIDKIKAILKLTAEGKKSFPVSLSSIGTFPNLDFPRIIWLGIDKGTAQIKELVEELEERIAKIGIPKEKRPFSSHITIGRIKSADKKELLIEALKNTSALLEKSPLPEFPADKITFFKSTLTPKGPIYEILKEVNLRTN